MAETYNNDEDVFDSDGFLNSPDKCAYFPEADPPLYSKIEVYNIPSTRTVNDIMETPELNPEKAQEFYYSATLENGFRRSCFLIYRNTCPHCKKCQPVRVPFADFKPSKSQRHILRKNSDIEVKLSTNYDEFLSDEKIDLYIKYMQRHNKEKIYSKEEGFEHLQNWNGLLYKEPSNPDDWSEVEKCSATLENRTNLFPHYKGLINLNYYLNGKLIGCSILDFAFDKISSAYFYYDIDPELMKRSLGTFSILYELEYFKNTPGLIYYDLGYWLRDCPNMVYKCNFRPCEILVDGEWIPFDDSMKK